MTPRIRQDSGGGSDNTYMAECDNFLHHHQLCRPIVKKTSKFYVKSLFPSFVRWLGRTIRREFPKKGKGVAAGESGSAETSHAR